MDGESDALSFYVDVKPGEFADLEIVSAAAIAWSQAVKAAAQALYPDEEIRVSLIAAERGSSNWLAKIERSSINKGAVRVAQGWKALPLVVRLGIGLVVVVPTTAIPTWEYWTDTEGFSDQEKDELREIVRDARTPTVVSHQRQIYRTVQRDPKITGLGTGVPDTPFTPKPIVPANQFALGDGLFDLQEETPEERVLTPTLDVILVTPRLENAPRSWTFRQEGIPGTFDAIMKDKRFLAALDRQAVREQFRSNIPMKIRLEVKENLVDGEWKVRRKGRSVTEVISPQIDL
jgi:hypothetical protein